MPSPSQILSDPNYVNANSATKRAIFDKLIAVDPSFVNANAETKTAIRQRFGSLAFDNPTSVSATPTGPMAAIRQFRADVAGNTAERARPYLEASQATQAKYRKPGLAGALELYNPLNMASNVGNALGAILAPVGGVGDTIGTRIDPVFGKPGSGGGEQRKYGDVLQLATPLPGGAAVKGGKAVMGAVDLAGALAAAKKAQGAVGVVMAAPFKAGGRILDAGATPAAQDVVRPVRNKLASLLQERTLAEQSAQTMKGADSPLRKAMNAVSDDLSKRGIGVSDTPEAKAIVLKAQEALNPLGPVVTRASRNQTPAYRDVINVLTPQEIEVGAEMAGKPNVLARYGKPKGDLPGSVTYVQIQKPSLEGIVNLRRELQESAYRPSNESGYGAIGSQTRKELIEGLKSAEDAYTSGASVPVRDNWKAMLAQQEKADELLLKETKFSTQLTELDTLNDLSPIKASKRARTIATELANNDFITQAEYADLIKLSETAMDARKKSIFRKRVTMALGALGASQTPMGSSVLHAVVGVP